MKDGFLNVEEMTQFSVIHAKFGHFISRDINRKCNIKCHKNLTLKTIQISNQSVCDMLRSSISSVTARDCYSYMFCVFGGLCVDMWRFVHQWSFLLFWLSSDCFDCFWLLLTVFDDWYTVSIVKNSQNHWCTNCHRSSKTAPTVYQQCTNSVPIVKNSQKTVRTARIAIGVPIITCLHRVRRIHKAILTTPTGLLCLHISQRGTCNQVRIK